jgi:hypothetical protein
MLAFAVALVLLTTAAPDPLTATVDRIEAERTLELGAVSFDGHLGQSSVELALLLERGESAAPALRALASSTSPVARVVGAVGLARLRTADANDVLARLAKDPTRIAVRRGCLGLETTVADAIQQALAAPR